MVVGVQTHSFFFFGNSRRHVQFVTCLFDLKTSLTALNKGCQMNMNDLLNY